MMSSSCEIQTKNEPILVGASNGLVDLVTRGRKNPLWTGCSHRVGALRTAADMTADALNKLSGVSKNVVNRLEDGVNTPKIDTVERIAAGLGVSPIYLGFGTEGGSPFRLKTPSELKNDVQPIPRPGEGVFAERYKGCAARLKGSRERLGLSLRELSAAAQVSYQAVLYTESGQTVPRVDTIEAIAVALDVAPGWLAYGEDE